MSRPECAYCDKPLFGKFERDHMPIPARHDGEDTVPTCRDCHDLKDRIHLNNWPVELVGEAWKQMGPVGRIFVAKAFAVHLDQTTPRAG